MCSESCLHGVGLPKSLRIGRNGPRSECNLRLLFINDGDIERQPLVFVPEGGLDETGTITVSYPSNEFYLDADLNNEDVGTWCVDSETVIYTGQDDDYTIFNPCEDNLEDLLPVDSDRFEDHYADIDWYIISYIINNYNVGDEIECPYSGNTLNITNESIQYAIWSFTNPGEYSCPVDDSGDYEEDIECDSGCAIVNEVKQVFWISE